MRFSPLLALASAAARGIMFSRGADRSVRAALDTACPSRVQADSVAASHPPSEAAGVGLTGFVR